MIEKAVASLVVVGLAACGSLEEENAPEIEQYVGPVEGMETQGRYLTGEKMEPLGAPGYHLTVGPKLIDPAGKITTVRFDNRGYLAATDASGQLHAGADPWFHNQRLPIDGGPATFEILRVTTVGSLTSYKLVYRALPADPPEDPCFGSDAVAVAGKWKRDGSHVASSTITVACLFDGVIAKCVNWGYPPGPIAGSPPWLAHQGCTRMARFDMCGDGVSYTHPGTLIGIYDFIGVNNQPPASFAGIEDWPPPAGNYYYEALWGPDGADCVGKLRWQHLAAGSPCPTKLPDPRTDPAGNYCLDVPPASTGITHLSTARYNALGLHEWVRGFDRVSTVRGYYGHDHEVQPFDITSGYVHVRIDAMMVRAIPDSVQPWEVKEVRLYTNPTNGDRVVSDMQPTGYADHGFEGYVFTYQKVPTMVPFREYVTTTGERHSTTGGAPPPPYSWNRDIGWLNPL